MLIAPLVLRSRAPRFVRDFFTGTTSPINLAMFRIALFTIVLFSFSIHNVAWFAGLPAELRFPPAGLGFLVSHFPINQTVAWYAAIALTVSCVLAIVGLCTRTSIIISAVLSIYVLGLPQLFGKINHYHHLIWFMLILAVAPCAEVLSIDAIRKSWKRADHGVTEPPPPSVAYALPLRFVWLLMGVIYFSAGFWKVWTGGVLWAWSNNPRNMMYNKWMELAGWTPLFRIDQHPLLFKLSALFTIAFELSFIFLIFFAAVRWLAPAGGAAFHTATNLFMRISFWNLQGCYVAFVDWSRCFKWVGRRLFAQDMHVVYDGNCKLCRRTVASFRVFDLFERVTYVNALESQALAAHDLSWLDSDALLRDLHVVLGKKTSVGFAAYREWVKRLPLFWIAVPFMYLWPVKLAGNKTYRHVADSRACSIAGKPLVRLANRKSVRATGFVGCLLVYLAVLSAVGKIQSWPMAGYPTFEDIDPAEVHLLTVVAENDQGEVRELRPIEHQSLREMPPERLMGLQNRLISIADANQRARRLQAFWEFWQSDDPALRHFKPTKFYGDTVSSLPEDRNHAPIRRELIVGIKTKAGEALVQNRAPKNQAK